MENKYFEALNGITYDEWTKLELVVNRYFDLQKNELNKSIQLKDVDEITRLAQTLLG